MLTELESKVYDAAVAQCDYDYCSSVKELASILKIDVNSVKGAVGSLVKKGRMAVESEVRGGTKFFDLFPVNEDGKLLSFGEWN